MGGWVRSHAHSQWVIGEYDIKQDITSIKGYHVAKVKQKIKMVVWI